MNTRYRQNSREAEILGNLRNKNISFRSVAHTPAEFFSEIFSQEKEQYMRILEWEISLFVAEKYYLIEIKSLFGFCLVKDKSVIAYIIIIPVFDFYYINSMNILTAYRFSGLLEDLLMLTCIKIMKKGSLKLEGQPFIFEYDLNLKSFTDFSCNYLSRVFMAIELDNTHCEKSSAGDTHHNIRFVDLETSVKLSLMSEILLDSYYEHPESGISSFYLNKNNAVFYLEEVIKNGGCGTCLKGSSFACYCNDKIIGFVLTTSLGKYHGHITQIAVKKEFQKKRLGSQLLSRSLSSLYENDYKKVSLSVTAGLYTIKWYEKFGFKRVMDFYGFRFNK